MRAVLTSLGSTGDVEPFVALAAELGRAGHHPVLALSPNFAANAARRGIPFVPLGPELKHAEIRGMITTQMAMPNPVEQARHFIKTVMPVMPRVFRELKEVCRGADVVICSPHQIAGRMVHETTGVRHVSVHLSQFNPTSPKALREAVAPVVNEYRAREGLPPLEDPLGSDGASAQLALYAVSPLILRRTARWPAHHQVTGFFFNDDDETQCPDPELARFVAGAAPVVVTLGSVVHEDAEAVTDLILSAIERVGCRAVIQRGWSGLALRRQLPEQVYAAGFVPHGWLFRQAACVVHHGGAGTAAAALRAGVPSVIIPHTLDQPIWAELVRALGAARAVIPYPKLTAESLARAIAATLDAQGCRQAAARVGEQIRGEHGVAVARRMIEQLASAERSIAS